MEGCQSGPEGSSGGSLTLRYTAMATITATMVNPIPGCAKMARITMRPTVSRVRKISPARIKSISATFRATVRRAAIRKIVRISRKGVSPIKKPPAVSGGLRCVRGVTPRSALRKPTYNANYIYFSIPYIRRHP